MLRCGCFLSASCGGVAVSGFGLKTPCRQKHFIRIPTTTVKARGGFVHEASTLLWALGTVTESLGFRDVPGILVRVSSR